MNFLEDWAARSLARHEEEVAAGQHDDTCEWRSNGHHLCHCSKRKREADGQTTPLDDLIFSYPTCPRCYETVDGDGDSYYCTPCKTTWDTDGTGAQFTDDYGDIDPTPWDARAAEEKAKAEFLATAMADPEGHRLVDEMLSLPTVIK